MKKITENLLLLCCITMIVVLIPIFLINSSPLVVIVPSVTTQGIVSSERRALSAEERKAQEEQLAEQRVMQEEQRKERERRVYACKIDDDCIIVDKDPCGCSSGPEGVIAINVGRIADFNILNKGNMGMKVCPEKLATWRECSVTAHPVCRASVCKIEY